jgi:hypothetical protein
VSIFTLSTLELIFGDARSVASSFQVLLCYSFSMVFGLLHLVLMFYASSLIFDGLVLVHLFFIFYALTLIFNGLGGVV